jgi:hypothetical protein
LPHRCNEIAGANMIWIKLPGLQLKYILRQFDAGNATSRHATSNRVEIVPGRVRPRVRRRRPASIGPLLRAARR